MNTTNIFEGRYEKREDQLTYRLLCLVEHLDTDVSGALLSQDGLDFGSADSISVDTLYGGFEGNPDGSIQVDFRGRRVVVFLEVKHAFRGIDLGQIERHLADHVGDADSKTLLVIGAYKNEGKKLRSLTQGLRKKVHFATWAQIRDSCLQLAEKVEEGKDMFLLEQFAEYLSLEPYTGIIRMIDRDLLQAITKMNERNLPYEFETRAWSLVTEMRDKLRESVPEVQFAEVHSDGSWTWVNSTRHEAGIHIQLGIRRRPDGAFPLAGDPKPQFGVWVAIDTKLRLRIDADASLQNSVRALSDAGWMTNTPRSQKRSGWFLCGWFQPADDFTEPELDREKLHGVFAQRLRELLGSEFLRRTIALAKA